LLIGVEYDYCQRLIDSRGNAKMPTAKLYGLDFGGAFGLCYAPLWL